MNLQKRENYRNKTLLNYAKDSPCQFCGSDDKTVVADDEDDDGGGFFVRRGVALRCRSTLLIAAMFCIRWVV